MKEVERNNVVTVRQRESEMFILNESYLLQKLLFHFVLLIKSYRKREGIVIH